MVRSVMVILFGCLLVSSQAHAGKGGVWVMEWLMCMDSAESAGVPRDQARSECSQTLTQKDVTLASAEAARTTGQGGVWVLEWLMCMDSAESAGVPRDQARSECTQTLMQKDVTMASAEAARTDGKGGTWVMEWLMCMDSAESAGVPRDQARSECSQTLQPEALP